MSSSLPRSIQMYIRREKARIRRIAVSAAEARVQCDTLQRRFHPQTPRGMLINGGNGRMIANDS